MPQIIVTADRGSDANTTAVLHRERVSRSDFESGHFQAQLVERIGWAVGDADHVEQQHAEAEQFSAEPRADRMPDTAWAT